jgi:thiamine-phosphate pyrophosphorylase
VETALKVRADGAHVGQNDLAAAVARKWLGAKMILGVSVYTVEEALRAQAAGADYLGVGPVFATKTKTDAQPPMGIERLGIIARAVTIPVIAIGGIVHNNAAAIVQAGIDGVAVISAIIDQPNPAQATRVLSEIVRSAKAGVGRGSLVLAR